MYCPQCGANSEGEAGTCASCGLDLDKYKEQWRQDPEEGQAAPGGIRPGDQYVTGPSQVQGGYQSQQPGQSPAYQQPPSYQQGPAYRQGPGYQQGPPYQQMPYQGGYQGPPYAPYGPQGTYGQVPRIPSYLGWAIAVLILCFWPTGIVAVVYASQVDNKLVVGDIAGAQYSSRKARLWCWITFGIAIAGIVIAIIVAIIAVVIAAGATAGGVIS